MRGKNSKGKQKIDIKKVEKDDDRLVTFSKRKSGIHTKLSELSVLCGAEVGFLVYSGTGKPYTFGNPSFETVAQRFLTGEVSPSLSIVDAHKKVKLKEICESYNSSVEQSDEEGAIGTARAVTAEAALPVEENAWWKVDPEKVKEKEDVMQLLKKYEELYAKLYEAAEKRNDRGNVASSSRVANNHNG